MSHIYLIVRQPEIGYAVIIGENYSPSHDDVKKLGAMGQLPGVTDVSASLTITPFPRNQDGLSRRVREYAAMYPKLDLETAVISLYEA
jgi:hypothetical protein